jgi:hypothetical protein
MKKYILYLLFGLTLAACEGHKPKSNPQNTEKALNYQQKPDSMPEDHSNVDNNDHPLKNQ